MTTHRDVTKEQVDAWLSEFEADGWPAVARDIRAHIAALEARAETLAGERDRWQRLHGDASARADAADVALAAEERAHAETRAMHSQMCKVAMEHQRDRDSARDAALEEAAQQVKTLILDRKWTGVSWGVAEACVRGVRALKTQPSRRFVDEQAVRRAALEEAEDRLSARGFREASAVVRAIKHEVTP